MAAKTYPGVTPLGRGWYRIRTEVRHPKTGRVHEIDRKVRAPNALAASRLLATARDAWLAKHARGVDADGRRRLGSALDAWLDEKRATVKASTASTYGSAARWWRDVLGDYYLDALEPSDIREALSGARDEGDQHETLCGRLRVLKTFAREEDCARIVHRVKLEKDVRTTERDEDEHEEGRGLSPAELRALLAHGPTAWKNNDGYVNKAWARAWALFATLLWTGLRFGEASALEWKDIDLDAKTIRVRRAQWRGIVDHPKAKASKRTVVIPDELVDVLAEHRGAMAKKYSRIPSGLVFPTRRTTAASAYVTNTQQRKTMMRACAAATGKTYATTKERDAAAKAWLDGRPALHCLRHAFNNLLRQHAPELVRQSLIGHADEVSGERYSKVGLDEKRAAVDAVRLMLVRGGGGA